MLKLFDPNVSEEEVNAAKQVLLSHNWASGAGLDWVNRFEQKFAEYIGCKSVITVNSGTAALHLALSIVASGHKDTFVPSLSFVSTAHAGRYNGANVIFVDVDPFTLCMDPDDLESKIDSSAEGNAVIPVHFGGMPCDMDKLQKIAKSHGISLIDDAAHACGSNYKGNHIGSLGDMTCFSFHPVKNLSMPSGGAIAINTNNPTKVKNKLLSLRWCGLDNRVGTSYDVTTISPNYYLNEISAAIGLVQLKKLNKMNHRRIEIARRYCNELKVEKKMPFSKDCVYHLYWILSPKRERMINYLNGKGIEIGTHYRPIHTMSAYQQKPMNHLPITEKVGKEIITLPIHTNLGDNDISYIIDAVNNYS